ncbi:MAG: hypothetical protein ACRD1Y_06890, partial [Terriglobales bacterium]
MRRFWNYLAAALAVAACAWLIQAAARTWRAAADENASRTVAASAPAQARADLAAALRYRPDRSELWRLRAADASFAHPRQA